MFKFMAVYTVTLMLVYIAELRQFKNVSWNNFKSWFDGILYGWTYGTLNRDLVSVVISVSIEVYINKERQCSLSITVKYWLCWW